MNTQSTINQILELKTIAVVGFSPKPERPSHYVSIYLKEMEAVLGTKLKK